MHAESSSDMTSSNNTYGVHVRDRLTFSNVRSRLSRNFPPNLARLMLLCCAALWGGSYLVAKIAVAVVPPFWLMALRTGGACIVMMILFHKVIVPALNFQMLVPALIVGITYFGTMGTQTVSLQTVDAGRCGFLTALYCVLIPFASWLVSKRRPGFIRILAGCICMVGVGFVALKPSSLSIYLSPGDWLAVSGAVIYSFNLTYLGIYARRFNSIALTFAQFAVACALFLITAIFSEPTPNSTWLDAKIVGSFLYLSLGGTTLAQIMQNIGLAHVPITSASIVMCTECLFAELFSFVFGGERPQIAALVGFCLIFIAVLLSMTPEEKLLKLLGGWRKRSGHS